MERLIKILTPILPTDGELKVSTAAEWAIQKDVLLSRLPIKLLEYSIPTFFFEVFDLKRWIAGFDSKKDTYAHESLIEGGNAALEKFPQGFFFKTDNRSPKDSGIIKFTHQNLHELPSVYFSSMRMLEDMVVARVQRESIILCYRQWVDLADEQRVFVRNGKIQGVSRYDYNINCENTETELHIGNSEKLFSLIQKEMHLNDYVFDFGYIDDNPVLIELNPYGMSDPCCFGDYSSIAGYKFNID